MEKGTTYQVTHQLVSFDDCDEPSADIRWSNNISGLQICDVTNDEYKVLFQ